MTKAGITARIAAHEAGRVAWVAVYPADGGFMVFTVEIPEHLADDSACYGEESITRRNVGTFLTIEEVDGAVTGLGIDPDELDAPWRNDYPL